MQKDRASFLDILDSCKKIMQYTEGKTLEAFLADTACQDAVIRRIEIMGEAARRISDEMKTKYPELPWQEMIGMRNVMIHEYDGLDIHLVWETVSVDVPALADAIQGTLRLEGIS